MNTISLENAKVIIENHKVTDNIEDPAKLYRKDVLTPTESCAGLIWQYARTKITKKFGATIIPTNLYEEPALQVSRGEMNYIFQEIPVNIIRLLGCGDDCHENCINACVNGIPNNAIIHTSEVSVLPEEKTKLPGLLHSYMQLGEEIFDLKLGIKMSKESYDKLFNVNEISELPVSKVRQDIQDGTLSQIVKHSANISREEYLMARDDCARLVGAGK